ncbi:MAG: dethiobiotin synthase [Gammaproteobacteria bacterium]
MAHGFFVTGTDTNVGKTWASVALMRALQAEGKVVVGMKPVAAGCEWQQGRWKNHDALLLQRYGSAPVDYQHINPYAFKEPLSPHIACGDVKVDLDCILREFRFLTDRSDCVVVEGAGGWFSPLGYGLDNAGLAKALRLPVVVVVGMRLGCINHARLTVRAIHAESIRIAGWLAVQLTPYMPGFEDNLMYLKSSLQIPFLGTLPHLETLKCDVLSNFVRKEKLNNL